MFRKFSCGIVAAGIAFTASLALAGEADLLLVNGKIVTVDDQFRIAQAVAIKGSRIVAVGKTADVRKEAAANAKVIDLKGRTVIPGLIDNHSHWIRAAEHDELLDTVEGDEGGDGVVLPAEHGRGPEGLAGAGVDGGHDADRAGAAGG